MSIQKHTKINKTGQKKMPGPSLALLPGLIILGYMLIPTYTPNLSAFDTNAPKFLALALVNLAAFILLLTDHKLRQYPDEFTAFFKSGIGWVYTGFLVATLLSMLNAINLNESVVQLAKIFSVFTAVYILSIVIRRDIKLMHWVVLIFTGMLIIDALSVIYHINQFIKGDIEQIADIKTIYSNKNILSSAIFVKLPFALWLLMFSKGWQRILGWVALTAGIAAVFFMATRAFYFGLIILSIAFLAYLAFKYLRTRQKSVILTGAYYLAAMVLAYLVFTGTQQFLYPKAKSNRHTQGVGEQLATIGSFDSSISKRIDAWKWSAKLLKEKPLLGVGTGNWKVSVLKYENQKKANYEYLYKAHNDFIEITAETGLTGGLLYLAVFVLIAIVFVRKLIYADNWDDEYFRLMFLSAAGMLFYSVDAVFNFPADRPEILVLFSFSLATGIAVIKKDSEKELTDKAVTTPVNGNKLFMKVLAGFALVIMLAGAYVFYLNYESSKLQRIAFEEIKSGRLTSQADKFLQGFPSIPDLNINGEPIDVIKSRYLLKENRNEEALRLLRTAKASPWDGRREYFMSMGFNSLNMIDSAIVYAEKLRLLKPNHGKNTLILCQKLEEQQEYEKAGEYLDDYLERNKRNSDAWVFASGFYNRRGQIDKAWEIIGEGKQNMPDDSLVVQQYNFLYQRKFVDQYRDLYTRARQEMDNRNYTRALTLINEYIGHVPGDFFAHQVRAYIYYYQKEYEKSVEEITYTLSLPGDNTGAITNLRGVCYHALNDLDAACKDFEAAMKLGEPNGISNYERFCKNRGR
jgi:O-antigen ligase/Tfp pilus assembly protein PilF